MSFVSWLKKLLSSFPTQEEEDNAVLRKTPVSAIYRLHGTASAVIPEGSPLETVIARFAGEPSLRGMFLVDSMQKFSGVVTRIDLLKWAHLKLFGGKGKRNYTVSEIYSFVDANKAKDICRCAGMTFSVSEGDMLHIALDKMLDSEEDVLPVINSRNEIVGDLRLSEILSWTLTNRKDKFGNPMKGHGFG